MGSEGEPKAISYIKDRFSQINITMKEESFEGTKFWTTFLQIGMIFANLTYYSNGIFIHIFSILESFCYFLNYRSSQFLRSEKLEAGN